MASLRMHIKGVHYNTKKDTCQVCDLELANRKSLKEHVLRKHRGAKDFKCEICWRGFIRQSELVIHRKKIHKEL